MLAAVAAVLIVPIQQAHYLMGLDPLLLSFIVVIIGGLGSIKGTLVAALVIGMSDGIISVFFSPTLAKILATLLVALVLVVQAGRPVRGAGAMRRLARDKAVARPCRADRAPLRPAIRALRLPSPDPRARDGARHLCRRLQHPLRLYGPARASAMRCSSPPASTAPG